MKKLQCTSELSWLLVSSAWKPISASPDSLSILTRSKPRGQHWILEFVCVNGPTRTLTNCNHLKQNWPQLLSICRLERHWKVCILFFTKDSRYSWLGFTADTMNFSGNRESVQNNASKCQKKLLKTLLQLIPNSPLLIHFQSVISYFLAKWGLYT